MTYSCNSCFNYPCCCSEIVTTSTTSTTTTCVGGEPCDIAITSDCTIYHGADLPCYGITTGMTLTEILQITLQFLNTYYPNCTTTTSTTTSTTSTSTSSTTTTTTRDINDHLSFPLAWQVCLYGGELSGSPSCNNACDSYNPIECFTFYTSPLCAVQLSVGCILYSDNTYTTQATYANGFYSDGTYCYEIINGVVTDVSICPSPTTTTTTLRVITDCTGIQTVKAPVEVNGNLITATYTGTAIYEVGAGSGWFACASPVEDNVWLGYDQYPFTYTINFSSPVNDIEILAAVMGRYADEVFTFTTDAGDPTITSTDNCYVTITGNQISGGLYAPVPYAAGGKFKFTTSTPYTSLTISGSGNDLAGGTLFGIVCSSI